MPTPISLNTGGALAGIGQSVSENTSRAAPNLVNPSQLAVRRANADGDPKSINASVKSHTDEGAGRVNYTQVVDDVFSQNKEGDCLPPQIQAKRDELKNQSTYNTPAGQEAAEELESLDRSIVEAAQKGDELGIQTQTFTQRQNADTHDRSNLTAAASTADQQDPQSNLY